MKIQTGEMQMCQVNQAAVIITFIVDLFIDVNVNSQAIQTPQLHYFSIVFTSVI